jgi:hypothetical protein
VAYTDANAVLWPALAEKAYAQLAEEGWSRGFAPGASGGSNTDTTDSYDALAYGDGGVACQQVSGWQDARTVDLIAPSKNLTLQQIIANAQNETALVQAFSHGSLVVFGSPNPEPPVPADANGVPLVIGNHVYLLQACDLTHDQFTLVNPYDDTSYYAPDGQRTITLSWAQLNEYMVGFDVVSPPSLIASEHVAVSIGQIKNDQLIASLSQVQPGDPVEGTLGTLGAVRRTELSPTAPAAMNLANSAAAASLPARDAFFASSLAPERFMTGAGQPRAWDGAHAFQTDLSSFDLMWVDPWGW